MFFQRLRRAALAAALATSALLAACGGGKIESTFIPTRGVLFDGAGNSWSQVVLGSYGPIPSQPVNGGIDASLGSVPIGDGLGTPSLAQRVDAIIASGGVNEGDLILLSGGVPDITAAANGAGTVDTIGAAGKAMADQIRRLIDAGAEHVLVANTYDVGKTPQFRNTPLAATATNLTRTFNDSLKVAMVDLGASVLLVDAEEYFNRVVANNGSGFSLTNVTDPACAGSTAGLGSVSSVQCTTGAFGGDPNVFLFYDPLYLTPIAQKLFGDLAYQQLRQRF